ncbi:hypothetical protein M2283_002728 [Streptomyces pseudovenezuelae]|uniref:Uncharacterized protein n=2 Tax=Streptomyces pseudovenezuelae TaxID=67350 RepID=A0ABT6LGK2_9ACTN|nr:hypothetical protein [Streptomyces pseudovenezuelae]
MVRMRNFVAALALLPLNFLVVGYGWLAAGMTGWAANWDEQPYEPPLTELGVAAGVVAAVGVALWVARLRGAAVFQTVPLLVLVLLMMPT